MLRPQGAPVAADHATETTATVTTDRPSFDQIGPKLAKPGHSNRTHRDMLSAIVTLVTSRKQQNIETYVGSWYKNNTVSKNNTIIEKVPYKNPQKMGSGPPSRPP
jgi:hypothetical protein